MRGWRLLAALTAAALLAFAAGWAFRAYLSPQAALEFGSRLMLCN